ncbi:MAG: AmmeMemoRadiSam system protein B [Candidatus Omnitrophica bacterium]|nr:AmmeMemoRadiSam system protein B [Candidatus Omnitrophota bacterium]
MRKVAIVITALMFLSSCSFASNVKDADLAGSWYPASKAELSSLLEGYLKAAQPQKTGKKVFAIIVPHAGYQFSGPVAAYGFKALQGQAVKTAIIIGFTHRKTFDGISVYDRGSFRTPLGDISVDTELAKRIIAQNSRIYFDPAAFSDENSVEMEIPFVQIALKGAKIVPIAFGTQSFDDAVILAEALSKILKEGDGNVIIASTDLSHYHSYKEANTIDDHTIAVLKDMDAKTLYAETKLGICEMCGILPVVATLIAAEKAGIHSIDILKYANSGDTFGNKSNVVGYVSAALYRTGGEGYAAQAPAKDKARGSATTDKSREGEKRMLNDNQRKRLLQIARESMTAFLRLKERKRFSEDDPVLNKELGAFVTLRENGELRGCIGNMIGQGPLYKTVADMAIEAATGDPRFRPLSSRELSDIDIEISVLSPLKKVSGPEEVEIPGHGVLVRRGFRSGVYLPQVATEAGWDKEEFLTSLCGQKAGISPDAWKDPATEMYVFRAEVFSEKDIQGGK